MNIRAIAFDCYGTLLNVTDDHFVEACGVILRPHTVDIDGHSFFTRWLEASKVLAASAGRDPHNPTGGPEPPFEPFRSRWPRNFGHAFAEIGLGHLNVDEAYEVFHQTLAQADAYPETLAAVRRLAAVFKVAVVSNADEDHLTEALARNAVPIDLVLSSERARSYKPRRPIFRQGADLLGEHVHDVLYVGDSPLADVMGARHAGMHVAWLNRAGVELPANIPHPDFVARDLGELAEKVLAAAE